MLAISDRFAEIKHQEEIEMLITILASGKHAVYSDRFAEIRHQEEIEMLSTTQIANLVN